jgi:arylsulfatase A-like enzyme
VGGLRSQLDLLPTLLEVLEVPWEGKVPGRSLLSTEGHERVLTSCWFTNTCLAMRTKERKWVYHYGQKRTEVFDLASDPLEEMDLAPQMTAAELLAGEQRMLAMKLDIDSFWSRNRRKLKQAKP